MQTPIFEHLNIFFWTGSRREAFKKINHFNFLHLSKSGGEGGPGACFVSGVSDSHVQAQHSTGENQKPKTQSNFIL